MDVFTVFEASPDYVAYVGQQQLQLTNLTTSKRAAVFTGVFRQFVSHVELRGGSPRLLFISSAQNFVQH